MAVPSAPHLRGHVLSAGKVGLTWRDVPGATSYDLYRGTTRDSQALLDDDVTAPYVDSLAAGTRGVYHVVAVNGDGDSDPSNLVSLQNAVITDSTGDNPGPPIAIRAALGEAG